MIIQSRMKSLKTRLYGVQDPSATARQKKFIEVITGLGGIIIVGWLALKFLFPQVGEVKADFFRNHIIYRNGIFWKSYHFGYGSSDDITLFTVWLLPK